MVASAKEKKVIAIIGADGQLGTTLKQELEAASIDYVGFSKTDFDVSKEETAEKLLRGSYNVLVNCAAWTDVESAEIDNLSAFRVNQIGARNVALASQRLNARLIHISTDYVFSGEKMSPYKEEDVLSPLNQYGASKANGELAVLEVLGAKKDYVILRTSWLYSEHGKNFAKTMVRKAILRETVRVVNDQVGQPTNTHDLAARLIEFALGEDLYGTFHLASNGETTWYEFARHIYKLVIGNPNLVIPIHSNELGLKAKRPKYSTLDCSKAHSYGISKMPMWDDSLERHIKAIVSEVKKENVL